MATLSAVWNYPLFTISSEIHITVGQSITVLVFVLVALKVGRFLSGLLARRMERGNVDAQAVQVIQTMFYWVFLFLVLVTAMGMVNIPIAHLAVVSGALAVGIGFGAQNIINNLISSWILMSEKPVRIGDFIEIDQHTGVVERIGNRSTRIRRIDGVHVLVPNSQMLERVVVNWTLVDRRFRSSVRVGVAYGSPVEQVKELMLAAGLAEKEVLADPPPVVIFEDFGDSALEFDLFFWCDTSSGSELRAIRSGIRCNIDRLFREHGIAIAFPQQDVHLGTSTPLDVRVRLDQPAAGDGA